MKFSYSIIIISAFAFTALKALAITAGTVPTAQDIGITPQTSITTVSGLVGVIAKIVTWTYTVFFIIAVLLILFAAFKYLTARGDPEAISTAHKSIIWAAVAIAVAFLSVAAEMIITDFLGP